MVRSLKERVEEEGRLDQEDRKNAFVGRVDPNQQLKNDSEELLIQNLVQGMNTVLGEILLFSVC